MIFYTKAFVQGTIDYKSGKKVTDNPFPIGSMNSSNWRIGWSTAENLDNLVKTKKMPKNYLMTNQ